MDVADVDFFVRKVVRVLKQQAGSCKAKELLPYKLGESQEKEVAARQGALRLYKANTSQGNLEFATSNPCTPLMQQQPSNFNLYSFVAGVVVAPGRVSKRTLCPHHLAAMRRLIACWSAGGSRCKLRGEFYHNFLVDARRLMASPPRPATASSDVDIPFQQSALRSTAQHDRLFQHFRLRWSDKDLQVKSSNDASSSVEVPRFDPNWDNMHLEYQLEWPMGLIITPAALCSMYGKRCGGARGARSDRSSGTGEGSYRVAELLQLRHHMAHLVTNLQIYIQRTSKHPKLSR
eukprot:gene174-1698_t